MVLLQIWNINCHISSLTRTCPGPKVPEASAYNLSLWIPLCSPCHSIIFALPVLPYPNVYQVFHSAAFSWGRHRLLCLHLKWQINSLLPLGLPWWLSWWRAHLQCRRPGFQSLDWEDPLEKGTATHSSILAWRTPWTI